MPFLSTLAEVCREHPLREKTVLVPSLAIGHQLGDALARAGTSWINLRFETTRTIADRVAGFELQREGWTVLSRAQALAIVERVCDRVLGSGSYFAALADRPGLHRAIQRSIDDLRHAGVEAEALRAGAFEDPRKAGDLARILMAYEEELRRGRYVDRFGVVRKAAELARGSKNGAPGDAVWVVLEDVELTVAEESLVRAVAGEGARVIGIGAGHPARCTFRKAVGEENEIRGALRAILAGPEPIDSAELVYTARDPYLPLAFELLAEYGLAATFAEGIPSHFTRPGQACLAFLRWIGDGWHAAELQAIATGRVRRAIRNAGIGWGRERHLPAIDGVIAAATAALETEENETARERLARSIDDAREARAFVAPLLEVTSAIAETIDVASAAAAAQAFVRTARVTNDVDLMAREGLARMFGEIAAIGGAEAAPSRSEIATRLADAVRNLHVAASNPRPGHIHVAPVRAGGWSGRPRLFVIGLDEERHPGRGTQDPVLLDVEREQIGVPIAGDRPQRVLQQFRAFLARASAAEVTLSWPSLRIADRREQFPSSALLEAFRLSTGRPAATYEELIAAAAEERFVDPAPLSGSDWWLYRRFAGGDGALRDAVLAAYPALADGALAEERRASDGITAWDGKIEADAAELDPRRNGVTYSASQLERMAGCPYRHFLERVLKIRPLEELVFDPDRWLEGREFGTLLHSVLERTMQELCAAGRKPALAFLSRMEEIAREELQLWRTKTPPPSEAAFQRRERDLLRSCEIFLRTEEARCGEVTPAHFEYAFDAFHLDLGGGRSIRLRGFIDRVDKVEGRDEWHVWDYKSGLAADFEGQWHLRCGTLMQHALYARAVEATLGGRVTKSGYLFPTPRGRGARIEPECTDDELRHALNLLCDVVASGWFPHAEECRYCEFEAVCGGRGIAAERTAAKAAAHSGEKGVRAWLRLQEVE